MESGNEKWLTVAEVAKQTGYSINTIEYLCRTGRIKAMKPGRDWFTTLEAVKGHKLKTRRGRPPSRKK
jgi:excisionase family DNA binding protein